MSCNLNRLGKCHLSRGRPSPLCDMNVITGRCVSRPHAARSLSKSRSAPINKLKPQHGCRKNSSTGRCHQVKGVNDQFCTFNQRTGRCMDRTAALSVYGPRLPVGARKRSPSPARRGPGRPRKA